MNFGHFLSCFMVTLPLVAGQSPKYALLGHKVSLKPKTNDVPREGIHILWKHNGDKVVEFNGHEERVYGSYEDRVTLDWHSAHLDIRDLRYEDTGEFQLEIHRSKIIHRSRFKLEVLEHMPMPSISCERHSDTSGQTATLTCSAQTKQSHPLTFVEWNSHGTIEPGPNLTISLGLQHDEDVYSCTVKNLLSNQTATFTAKECYSDSGGVVLTAVMCVAVIVAIAVALAVLFCKLKQKACFATDDIEDVEKQPPLLNPNGCENETSDHEEWRNSLHNKSTLPSNQRLRHLSQLDEQSDDCSINTEEEIKSEPKALRGTINGKGDLGEGERLLHNRETLPSAQRLGHLVHLNEEEDFNDEGKEKRKEEDNDVNSTESSPVDAPPDYQSTQNSANTTPNQEEFQQDKFALSEKDYVDIIDRKSGESDSGLDEEKDSVISPSLSVIDKEEITAEGPHDDDDDELSDQDDTGINQTPNINVTEPGAHTDEEEDPSDSKSSITEEEDGNEGPEEDEDDVRAKSPGAESHSEEEEEDEEEIKAEKLKEESSNPEEEEIKAEKLKEESSNPQEEEEIKAEKLKEESSNPEEEEEMKAEKLKEESSNPEEEEEIKAEKLKEESSNPEDECDSSTAAAEEGPAKLTEEDTHHQQGEEILRPDAASANAADTDNLHSELESTRKNSLSDTSSQQPRSPTLTKQADISSCSERFFDQESRHNSVSEQDEAFIELQSGPEEEQRPSKEGKEAE